MDSEGSQVYIARTDTPEYGRSDEAGLHTPACETPAAGPWVLLRSLFRDAGLDSSHYGSAEWNPLSEMIQPGDRVLLKPNWVLHRNNLHGGSYDCVVTHPSVIEAVLQYVVKAGPREVTIGDAPVQGCDFEALRGRCGLDQMVLRHKDDGRGMRIRDFRLTRTKGRYGTKVTREAGPAECCSFDLGDDSWLAPVTEARTEFRVADYDPDALRRHHHPGTHRYLIAREAMEADVVVNLPKLKTHALTGITGALKNMVGINVYKECLPHHRKGDSESGGDCYRTRSRLKAFAEGLTDRANRSEHRVGRFSYAQCARGVNRLSSLVFNHERNCTGGWYGNDTAWRMALDIQRILHYGRVDGTVADTPQRRVITICDGIVAGQGNGPLAPRSIPLGIMSFGTNVAALEWVHCLLMRMNPDKIPVVSHAFRSCRWPLASLEPRDIAIHTNSAILSPEEVLLRYSRPFTPADGWRGHCELEIAAEKPSGFSMEGQSPC